MNREKVLKSKAVETITQFSDLEVKRFRKFLKSEYFNSRHKQVILLDAISNGSFSNNNEGVMAFPLFQFLFPNREYDDSKLRLEISYLNRSLETFLAIENLLHDKPKRSILLMNEFMKRNRSEAFKKQLRIANQLNDETGLRNEDFFQNRFLVENALFEFKGSKQERNPEVNLIELIGSLDSYFIIKKLKLCCIHLARLKQSEQERIPRLVSNIAKTVEHGNFLENPAIALYYHSMMALKNSNEKQFFIKLKEQIKANIHLFNIDEAQLFYNWARHFCIQNINQGNAEYLNEALELYEDEIERNIFFKNGELSPFSLKNIVSIALRLGKFDYVEKFIQNHAAKISEPYRIPATKYFLTQLNFYKKNYQAVLTGGIDEIKFQDVFFACDARVLILRTNYELKNFADVVELCDRDMRYIKKRKFAKSQIRNYMNFMRFLRRLANLHYKSQKVIEKQGRALIDEIRAVQNVADMNWLISKLHLLLEKK